MIYEESEIAILSVGHMMEEAVKVREQLKAEGYACSLVNARFVKPIDEDRIDTLAKTHKLFVTIEEGIISGGYGEHVVHYAAKKDLPVKVLTQGISDVYVEQGEIAQLRRRIGLDADSIAQKTKAVYEKLR